MRGAGNYASPALAWGRPRALAQPRATPVWTASLMFFCGGIACLSAIAFPLISTESSDLVVLVGVLSLAFSVAVWLWGERAAWLLGSLTATGLLLVSMVVATCSTGGSAMTVTPAYYGMAAYYGYAFSRPIASLQWLLFAASFAAALLVGGFPHMIADWAPLSAFLLVVALGLNRAAADLRRRAETDPLTGLLNRRGFEVAASRAMAKRNRQPLAVAVIDVDGFKQVNDARGHSAGDRLLDGLAQAWKGCLRPRDMLARRGGDEFALALPSTSLSTAERMLDDMRQAVVRFNGMPVKWTYGTTTWRQGETLEACLKRADRALYEKRGRRDIR